MITQSFENVTSWGLSPVRISGPRDPGAPYASRTLEIELASGEILNIILYGRKPENLKIKNQEI